jgi:hypothetical protein
MPRSETDRGQYDVSHERYSSDLSGSEFAFIGFRAKALNCRRIVGVGNPGPLELRGFEPLISVVQAPCAPRDGATLKAQFVTMFEDRLLA